MLVPVYLDSKPSVFGRGATTSVEMCMEDMMVVSLSRTHSAERSHLDRLSIQESYAIKMYVVTERLQVTLTTTTLRRRTLLT